MIENIKPFNKRNWTKVPVFALIFYLFILSIDFDVFSFDLEFKGKSMNGFYEGFYEIVWKNVYY